MRSILDIKNCAITESDLRIYKFLCNHSDGTSRENINKFLATQVYDSTMKYFYEYSEDDIVTKKALNRLLNIDKESFSAIVILSIYYKVLKSEVGKELIKDHVIVGSKVSNKTIKYLMNKSGYYDYILYMLALSENLGLSDDFIEGMLNVFSYNGELIKEEIKLLDVFNNKYLMLDRCIGISKAI